MSATLEQARDEINAQINTAWMASVTSQGYPIAFDDVEEPPITQEAWCRVNVAHNGGGNANIGNKRFYRLGIVTVQIFAPLNDGLKKNDQLVKIVQDALEGQATASGVWFRSVRSREVGPDGNWHQTNVVAEFEYDEVK